MYIEIALAVLVVLAFRYIFYFTPIQRLKYRNLPGEQYSIFGYKYKSFIGESMLKLEPAIEYVTKYPRICYLSSRNLEILITDPALFKKAASIETRGSQLTQFLKKVGLVNENTSSISEADGAAWYDLRNLFNPAFNLGTVKSYTQAINQCVQNHIEILQQHQLQRTEVDIIQITKSLALQTILKAAFGVDVNMNKDEDKQSLQQIAAASQKMFHTVIKSKIYYYVFFLPTWMYFLFKVPQLPFKKMFEEYHKARILPGVLSHKLIEEKLSQRVTPSNQEIENELPQSQGANQYLESKTSKGSSLQNFKDWQQYRGPGLVKLLMERGLLQGKNLSAEQIQTNLTTIIIAGHETTSTIMAYCIWELTKNKSMLQNLLNEIDAQGPNFEFGPEDASKFTYGMAVINEVLRLHPIIQYTTRKSVGKDFKLDGYTIPEAALILFPVRGLHLSERYWPRPLEFLPERWLGNKDLECKSQPAAFFPFGYGPRVCLGFQFAIQETLITLVSFFKEFTFEIKGKTDLDIFYMGTLHTKDPMNVIVHKRC